MRTNEWHETSIAFANPSAEQLRRPPCRSSFGAKAIECTRMSSLPHCPAIASNTFSSCPGNATSSGRNMDAPKLARQRLDEAARLVVEIGDGEVGAELAKRLRASVGDRLSLAMPIDERLAALQHAARGAWSVMVRLSVRAGSYAARMIAMPRTAWRRSCPSNSSVWRAIISSSLVGTTHAATRLSGALMRGPPRAFASASSVTPSHAASRHTRSRSDRAVLADAGGEHDRVEAAERGGERAQLAPDAIDEQVDRGLRTGIVACLAACACRSRCPIRPAVPIAGTGASRSRARPS